jgi:hypothetical protein
MPIVPHEPHRVVGDIRAHLDHLADEHGFDRDSLPRVSVAGSPSCTTSRMPAPGRRARRRRIRSSP